MKRKDKKLSQLDRVNVRRALLYIKKTIAQALSESLEFGKKIDFSYLKELEKRGLANELKIYKDERLRDFINDIEPFGSEEVKSQAPQYILMFRPTKPAEVIEMEINII